MCAVPVKSRPVDRPSFDLGYTFPDEIDAHLDSRFLYRRVAEAMLAEGTAHSGRTLDVACGVGEVITQLSHQGVEGWGIDPSPDMLGINRWLFPDESVVLLRGIGETLPFLDATFDRVICQEALDHFLHPEAFMREAARILKPDGRLIISLSNYESLSCRLGRLRRRMARGLFRRPRLQSRPYWQPPPDHYHRGDISFVLGLGNGSLKLERCYGVSLMWLTYGWGRWLERLPGPLTAKLLTSLDSIAYRTPRLADMMISVWRPMAGTARPTGSTSPKSHGAHVATAAQLARTESAPQPSALQR